MRFMLLAACGGALGAMARYIIGLWALRLWGAHFPWGTFIVNIAGSFLAGICLEIILKALPTSLIAEMRALMITGVLGGFTTFSVFSLDIITLFERKAHGLAIVYIVGSVGLGILAALAGFGLAKWFFS